ATLQSALPLGRARIFWDGQGIEPAHGPVFHFKPTAYGPQTVEAEAYLPDGRRVFGVASFTAVTAPVAGKPEVSTAATIADVAEGNAKNGEVTFTRTGDTSAPLTVRYSLGGSASYDGDYNAINGNYWTPRLNTLVIPAGSATATIPVQVKDDDYQEPAETVVVTVLVDDAYTITNGRAVVTITSDE
ncbi:MAG: hypothetical protein ACJ790_08630, partial [Myxococcaceae bacterium]